MVIISADYAVIDTTLLRYTKSIESKYLDDYYSSIKEMKDDGYSKSRIESIFPSEDEAKKFKYYQKLSEGSYYLYLFAYGATSDFDFQIIKKTSFTEKSFAQISDSLNADYVLRFTNIHTENINNQIVLNFTTILYSNSKKKILLEKESTVDTTDRHERVLSCYNPLDCLLVNSVISSTEMVLENLKENGN